MISEKAHRVLLDMVAAEDADDLDGSEILREGRSGWRGYERVSTKLIDELLRRCLIRDVSYCARVERYTLNEDGRRCAKDRTYLPPELLGRKRKA